MELTPKQRMSAKIAEVVRIGKEKFGLDLGKVDILYNLRGRAAGMAQYRKSGNVEHFSIRFNADMLTREAAEHVIESTVPHEFAHIVCFMNPRLGKGHDGGWKSVCVALGGTTARCHKEEVVHGKGYTYEYHSSTGHKIRVGDKYHAMIRAGRPLTFKNGKGVLSSTSEYSIVGYQGRTLDTPKVCTPVPAPAKAEPRSVAAFIEFVRTGVSPAMAPVAPRLATVNPSVVRKPAMDIEAGTSKASISRRIMLAGYQGGKSYEAIIAEMIAANGYSRALARGTYKANAGRVGIPEIY